MTTLFLFVALFVFLIIGMPIAISLGLSSLLTILLFANDSMASLALKFFQTAELYTLLAIPFFVLAGAFMTTGGVARRMIAFANACVGHMYGGLAIASVVACMLFAAVSGSSPATVVAVGSIVIAGMVRAGYTQTFAAGVVCNAGTLGILIPPSTGFVIYAILTQQSIGRLFLAGVLPGILLLSMFIVTITVLCWLRPGFGPAGPRTTMGEKTKRMVGALPVLSVVILTIGGIYGGIFSPVEASAVGAGLIILIGAATGKLTPKAFWAAAKDSVVTTAAVMLILISAHILNPFLALTHIPDLVGAFLEGLQVGPIAVLALILLTYLILGCFLEGFAMLVLTMPIYFPVITQLGIDPIWFGVLVVLTLEMGLISPPVGVNVFIVKSVARDVPLSRIFAGVTPFWFAMLATLVVLIAFPQITLILPNTMMN